MNISLPAFSIPSRFQNFEWTSPNVENTLSTPALDEVALNNWSIDVSSQLLWLWMPSGNGTNWIHYFWHKHALVEWTCLCLIVYYAGHQIRIVFSVYVSWPCLFPQHFNHCSYIEDLTDWLKTGNPLADIFDFVGNVHIDLALMFLTNLEDNRPVLEIACQAVCHCVPPYNLWHD